jgi:hypothetical protein
MPALTGDVTSTVGTVGTTVEKIRGVNVDATAPTTGQMLVYNGTSWVPTTDNVSVARKIADQALTSSTPAAVTTMSFAAVAGVTYKFTMNIIFRSSSVSSGGRFGLTSPAGILSAVANIPIAGDGTGAAFVGSLTFSGDVVIGSAVAATNTDYMAEVEGIFVATANGTVQLTAGPETNGVTMTVRPGSMITVRVVP